MSGFDDIKIGWKGTEYQVAPTDCMKLLGKIEEILAPPGSGQNVIDLLSQPHKSHLTKLARAYATALRYAGCEVSDTDVYLSLARDVMQGGPAGFTGILTLSQGLMLMFFPEWVENEPLVSDGDAAGNAEGTAHSDAALSGTSMKSQSVAAG